MIRVDGHTDNIPIYTQRFRSNWELSSARAVSVAHEMMLATSIPSNRFLIQGFADTEPVAKNDSAANIEFSHHIFVNEDLMIK